ncbi:hypothetical protein [Psychroserpens algicola]|uniref:Uncharacterized protein n=1 Tax=Psychroserpens algicola TaxID=1719034 RepID=A0ABT0H9A0_9FLAO|nr:hypothetical protein [Psychroserpens algicola]MCK8480938.1 hypothetical protein [Psychroserpens algicola]
MIEFLRNGKELNGISMGLKIKSLYEIMGEPDEVIGDMANGYIRYNHLRYGYDESQCIIEMSIELSYLEKKLNFKNIKSEKYGIVSEQSFSISSKTKIHEFINFLNFLNISWQSDNKKDKNYLTLKLKPGPYVIFDLDNGILIRVSIVDGFQLL